MAVCIQTIKGTERNVQLYFNNSIGSNAITGIREHL